MDTIIWQRLEGGCVFLSAVGLFLLNGGGIDWWLSIVLSSAVVPERRSLAGANANFRS